MPQHQEKNAPPIDCQQFLIDHLEEGLLNLSKSPQAAQIITCISAYVKEKCGDLSTHQLRLLYMEVKKVQDPIGLQLIRPNFAYMSARQNRPGAKKAVDFFDEIIQKVDNPAKLEEFKNFMEAIVAYHKLHHGDKGR